jgi:hypothetical protein
MWQQRYGDEGIKLWFYTHTHTRTHTRTHTHTRTNIDQRNISLSN